jgi:hypothetical protein
MGYNLTDKGQFPTLKIVKIEKMTHGSVLNGVKISRYFSLWFTQIIHRYTKEEKGK